MGIYLVIIIFIVPLCAALYIWRDEAPKKNIYFMISSVSFLAIIILITGGDIMNTFMGLGLFLASTSFFAGAYLSAIVRARRGKEN